jgi:methylated-DNA-[protein]-cysteine S-methyltransferase
MADDTTTQRALVDELLATEVHDPAATAARHEALVQRAERDGLLDVAYRTVDSPVGRLLVASTPEGLVRLAFDHDDLDDVLADLADRVSPRVLRAPRRLDEVARELDEYFAGRRRTFDVPVDLRLARGFRRGVLEHLVTIPFGATESYAEVATGVGNPKAMRAVGTACATNPIALVVPCHRVVRSDGSIGNYGGGVDAKRLLLALESPRSVHGEFG